MEGRGWLAVCGNMGVEAKGGRSGDDGDGISSYDEDGDDDDGGCGHCNGDDDDDDTTSNDDDDDGCNSDDAADDDDREKDTYYGCGADVTYNDSGYGAIYEDSVENY